MKVKRLLSRIGFYSAFLTFGLITQAAAATLTVNTTVDEFNSIPNSTCSLREAIQSANTDADFGGCVAMGLYGPDLINLPGGTYTLTIPADGSPNDNQDGDLDITSALTITGGGADVTTIDGNGNVTGDRVIHINAPTLTVTIENVTISNGKALSGTNLSGGGILIESGNINLDRSTISHNSAGNGTSVAPAGCGGGIALISPNPSFSGFRMTNSTVSNNQAGNGDSDAAGGNGGGICMITSNLSQFTLINDTISGNKSGNGGQPSAGGPGGAGGSGGGIHLNGGNSTSIAFTTITDNKSGDGGTNGSAGLGGGIHVVSPTITGIRDSIIAKNLLGAGNVIPSPGSPDCSGSINSSFNLIGDGTGCTGTGGTGDLIGTSVAPIDPLLGPLANNGGPTQTHALLSLPLSPAIDAADNTDCTEEQTFDQRGELRPTDGDSNSTSICDIGAFELIPRCGDGVIQSPSEQCDDGNTSSTDGCSSTCQQEPGFTCTTGSSPSVCTPNVQGSCGNGKTEVGETCDDGNTTGTDGCSPTCQQEPGFTCTTGSSPSVCTPNVQGNCGDGTVEAGETCDDGNTNNADGCSSTCQQEPGFICIGSPSNCGSVVQGSGCTLSTAGKNDSSLFIRMGFLMSLVTGLSSVFMVRRFSKKD